jgi:transposase
VDFGVNGYAAQAVNRESADQDAALVMALRCPIRCPLSLKNPTYRFKRIGLEAGPLSQWLFSALAEASLPVICVETRHMKAVLKAQINKTDRNDARGIA